VAYYTRHLLDALLASDHGLDMRLWACAARPAWDWVRATGRQAGQCRTLLWPTRLKNFLWTRLEWPPIETFTGPVAIAHGAFHVLPAARRARRMATVFDLCVLRCPDTRPPGNVRQHEVLLRHAVARADALVAISESCKRDLVELLGARPERVHVVYGGVNFDEFNRPSSPEEDTAAAALLQRHGIDGPYLLHLGTLEPRKNLPRLLEAYARVRQARTDCPKLVLGGGRGWMDEPVFETEARLGLGPHVVHTGYLAREDAVRLLRGAYACVYPSLYEGFGLPVLEAMAAGTPVLASNTSSIPEVAGDTALLVDPKSADALEAGLLALLDAYGAARRRAAAACDRARGFSWNASAAALAAAYRAVARGSMA